MLACAGWGHAASSLKLVPQQHVQSKWQLAKIAVLATIFCLTVVMGNVSLRYIPVSFNQACFVTSALSSLLLCMIESIVAVVVQDK